MSNLALPIIYGRPGPVGRFLQSPGVGLVNLLLGGWASFRYFSYRHPWISRGLAALLLMICADLLGAQMALAADGSTTTTAGLAGIGIKDSHGIPVYQYLQLPIDRGDVWTYQKTLISFPIDILWAGHLFYVSLTLATITYLLSFEWVQIIATPLNSMAESFHSLTGEFKWIPFAMLVTAVVTGIVMLRGKFASAGIELTVAIVLALLATGVLANPVATVTGPEGALARAQQWGGEVAISITTPTEEKQRAVEQNEQLAVKGRIDGTQGTTGGLDAKSILSDTITAELTDIFIRTPAQTIAFGKTLTGKCESVFDAEMKKKLAFGVETAVRDRVGDCDADAKTYVQNTNLNQLVSTLTIGTGSFTLFLFALLLAFFFIFSVIMTIWESFKLMFHTLKGILPYIARSGFWYGLAGVASSVMMLVFALLFLAGYLKVIADVLKATSSIGVVQQMTILNLLLFTGIIILVVMHRKAKKAGETLGDILNRIGKSGERKEKKRNPVSSFATQAAPYVTPFLTDAIRNRRRKPRPGGTQQGFGGDAPTGSWTDMGERVPGRRALTVGNPRLALTGGKGPGPGDGPAPTPPPTGPAGAGPSGSGPAGKTARTPSAPDAHSPAARRAGRSRKAAAGIRLATKAAAFIPGGGVAAAGVKMGAKVASAAAAAKAADVRQTRSRIRVDSQGQGTVEHPISGKVVYTPPARKHQSERAIDLALRLAKIRAGRR